MDVGTRYGAGIDEPGSQERDVVSQLCLYTRHATAFPPATENIRVEPVNDDLGAPEAQHGGATPEAAAAAAAKATPEATAELRYGLRGRREAEECRPMHR